MKPPPPRMTSEHIEVIQWFLNVYTPDRDIERVREILANIESQSGGERVLVSRRELEQLNRVLHSVDIAYSAEQNASELTARWLSGTPDTAETE